jgi:hypothetical protein
MPRNNPLAAAVMWTWAVAAAHWNAEKIGRKCYIDILIKFFKNRKLSTKKLIVRLPGDLCSN